ncbi:MAG: restriction endonuclease subunit S [Chitinophagales bacterium]|nr:restriction endonuclease subunit S [Chitinophagales bacterium]
MSWEMVNINDICRPRQWKTLSIEKLKTEGYPVYGANGKIGFYNEFSHEYPTLAITCRGATCGSVHITEPMSYINGNAMALDNISEKININFLYYYFLQRGFSDVISGSAQPQITGEGLSKIQIPLPPLHIQKKIAQILDTADALKRKDQQLLKKYDELAQAIFIDMFGDPVKNEKGWEVKKLGGEFKSIRYGTGSPPKYSEQGIPFLRATNIKAGRIEKKGMVFLSEKEAQKIAKCFVNEGDLIIVRSGANTGDCAYISEEYANCLAGYDLIIEMEKVKSRFYNYFLNSIWGKAIIEKLSRRAGQPHLNSEQVSNIECISPKYYLLEKFNLVIDRIEKLRKLSIETNNVNNDLFQTLLQKAFNNELVTE